MSEVPKPSRQRWSRRTWIVIAAVVIVLIGGGIGIVVAATSGGGDGPAVAALQSLARSWSSGHPEAGPLLDPAGVAASYRSQTEGLDAGNPAVTASPVLTKPAATSEGSKHDRIGTLQVRWKLPNGTAFSYDTTARLVAPASGHGWRVQWNAAVVHPGLRAEDSLISETLTATRASILGAGGSVLVQNEPVVDVGVEPSRVKDLTSLTTTLAALLHIDGAALAGRVKASKPDAFVDVITLRRADYEALKAQLQPLPGTVFQTGELPLAPTHDFARALLGTVGPVTAELIKQHPGEFQVGEQVGLSGIQLQYQQRLAGTAGIQVVLHRGTTPGQGAEPADVTLLRVAPRAGQPLTTTLDPAIQQAADTALAGQSKPSALIAIRVSTGDVLAVANGPDGGAFDLGLTGQAPPGSTFKIVTTLGLLEGGLQPDMTVDCVPTITVDGRSFHNAEEEAFGPVPFHTDFAKSCNTAFVSLAPRLAPNTLQDAARSLGIGAPLDLGVPAFSGSVPVTTDPVDRAASSFGQGRILASPLSLALASASVARGTMIPPKLVVTAGATSPSQPAVTALPAAPIATLRQLMREVVTSGTGTAVAAVPGDPVYGKTGTAEHGTGPNPPSDAWFTGWQDDIAFCVFVQDGEFGGDTAAPIAAHFLSSLPHS